MSVWVLTVDHVSGYLVLVSGTAGAGSLILEFATLSRLTGDERFEKAASKVIYLFIFSTLGVLDVTDQAFFALWNRRSEIGLVGNTINTWNGVRPYARKYQQCIDFCMQEWTAPEVMSIGAGVDSFFEYALKWYILSGVSVLFILSVLLIFCR